MACSCQLEAIQTSLRVPFILSIVFAATLSGFCPFTFVFCYNRERCGTPTAKKCNDAYLNSKGKGFNLKKTDPCIC